MNQVVRISREPHLILCLHLSVRPSLAPKAIHADTVRTHRCLIGLVFRASDSIRDFVRLSVGLAISLAISPAVGLSICEDAHLRCRSCVGELYAPAHPFATISTLRHFLKRQSYFYVNQ